VALRAPTIQVKTYDDLQAMPDDGNRYELIHGEIVMSPAPKPKHQAVIGNLYVRLREHLTAQRMGMALFSPVDVRLSPHSVVEPAIVVMLRKNVGRIGEELVDGPPDVVVEVLSPSNRAQDLVRKAALYAEHGVPEYWIVDLEAEAVAVHVLVDGMYQPYAPDEMLAVSSILTGFAVAPAELFAEPEWLTGNEVE
jgi:Uma2 family endonuclease